MTHVSAAIDVPILKLTDDERRNGGISLAGLRDALRWMSRDGFVQINDVLPREFVLALQRARADWYSDKAESALQRDSLRVADRRYMITVDVSGPFNDPLLYGNPYVFPAVSALLGGQAVIDSFGAVCALPGAPAQDVHVDHPPLFPENQLSPLLPCHAVTMVLPLVDLNPVTGSTAVWLGSHRESSPMDCGNRNYSDAFIPETTLGSVYLMDYRLVHGGTPNSGDRLRPILYIVYARPWFTDASNFSKQTKIRISAEDLAIVPDDLQPLFRRAS